MPKQIIGEIFEQLGSIPGEMVKQVKGQTQKQQNQPASGQKKPPTDINLLHQDDKKRVNRQIPYIMRELEEIRRKQAAGEALRREQETAGRMGKKEEGQKELWKEEKKKQTLLGVIRKQTGTERHRGVSG